MNKVLVLFILPVFMIGGSTKVSAQTKDTTQIHESSKQKRVDSLAREADIIDFLNNTFHWHLSSKPDTLKLKPGKLFFALVPAIGYTLEASWLANITFNTSFYTSNPDSTNLSSVNCGPMYSLRQQFILPIQSDIWLKNNKLNLLGDWRFYRYPSYTYGLGGNTLPSDADLIDYSYLRIYQEVLAHFNSYFYFGGGYNYDYHFDIAEQGKNTSFESYPQPPIGGKGVATQTVSSGPLLHFMYDSRANANNARDAFYGSITYRYNTTVLGSTQPWQSLFVEIKKFLRLSRSSPNVLAFWSWNVFTFGGNAPYFDLPSNGWDVNSNSGRGYIQGRFRGQNMLYDEVEYRFRITRNGLIGGVVFANAESVSNYPGNKFTTIAPGYGAGFRIKMNKYSDVNLCIDYGLGTIGSRGFFGNLGEVF